MFARGPSCLRVNGRVADPPLRIPAVQVTLKTQPARRPFRNRRAGCAWVERETFSGAFRKNRRNFHANCHRNFRRAIRLRYIRRHLIVVVAGCSSADLARAEDCSSAGLVLGYNSVGSELAAGCKPGGWAPDFRYTPDEKAPDFRCTLDAAAPGDCTAGRQLPACAYPMEAGHFRFPDTHFLDIHFPDYCFPDIGAALAPADPLYSDLYSDRAAVLVLAE